MSQPSGSGLVTITGTGSVTLAVSSIDATGVVTIVGSGSLLPISGQDATGLVTITGTAAVTLGVGAIDSSGTTDPEFDTAVRFKHWEVTSDRQQVLRLNKPPSWT